MISDVKDILNGLELIHMCCEAIEDNGGCDECPMGSDCFEYNSLLDSFENISAGRWEKFVKFADNIEEHMRERHMTREERRELGWEDEYDRKRKGERDEEYLEEQGL